MPDCAEAGGNGVSSEIILFPDENAQADGAGESGNSIKQASPSAACDLYRRPAGLLGCMQLRGRGMAVLLRW